MLRPVAWLSPLLLSGCMWQEGLWQFAKCGDYALNLPEAGESIANGREACGPVPGANGTLGSDDSATITLRPWHRPTDTWTNLLEVGMSFFVPADHERDVAFDLPAGTGVASVTVIEDGEVFSIDVAPLVSGTAEVKAYGRDDRDGIGWDGVHWKVEWDLVYGDPDDPDVASYVTHGTDWVWLEPPIDPSDTGW